MANDTVPDSKFQQKEGDIVKAIEEFVDEKSSMSLIHYFPQSDPSIEACDAHKGDLIL